jgi:hypothetical protein
MKRLVLLLLPVALFGGQQRFARLGEFDGFVQVQLHPADPWSMAERNLTLRESAWLRTGASSRLEIEFDEGSAWRLGPESQVEISDYSVLSSGQRLTILSIERGVAWFTGEPFGKDTLMLVAPGAQVTLIRGARVRIEAGIAETRVSVIEGVVRLSCPAAEIDLREGQSVRVEPDNKERFVLDREFAPMELDRWSEDRDKLLAAPVSSSRVQQHFGSLDLDSNGQWLQTDIGAVWKPKVGNSWVPFQNGHWHWYDGLGYTWVSSESWGWLPYHFGRWSRRNDLGWVWAPSQKNTFKPGDVFWLYGMRIAGWGPLAPGEQWSGTGTPQQFMNANTTWAPFPTDAQVIDPAGFSTPPADPLAASVFRVALPSPAFPASRLEAVRPQLRVGSTHFTPVLPGTTFQDINDVPPPPEPLAPIPTAPPSADGPGAYPPDPGPGGPPMQTTYPVPAYTGIIVINPPDHPDYGRRNPNNMPPTRPSGQTSPPASQPPAGTEPKPRVINEPHVKYDNAPRVTPVITPRGEPTRPPEPNQTPAPAAPSPAPRVEPPSRPAPPPSPREAPRVEQPRPTPAPAPRETPRVETPRPAPPPPASAPAPAPREAPRVETPRPSPAPSPRVETPKVEAKSDTKVDTPKKQ